MTETKHRSLQMSPRGGGGRRTKYESWTRNDFINEIEKLKNEKYGLVWVDKKENFDEEANKRIPILAVKPKVLQIASKI